MKWISEQRGWFAVGAGLVLAAGLVAGQWIAPRQWQAQAMLAAAPSELDYGNPDRGVVLKRPGYSLSYDGRTRLARWVGERLTAANLEGNAKRTGESFHVDTDLPDEFRARPIDYQAAGFDRGHLACAANHPHDQREMDATFSLSNITPQLPKFNRGIWKQLEQLVRDLASVPGTRAVFVFSGPLWMSKEGRIAYDVMGPDELAVPTHFFKTVLVQPAKGDPRLLAWIIPHDEDGHDLNACRVTIDGVERASGCNFWGELDDDLEDRLEGTLAADGRTQALCDEAPAPPGHGSFRPPAARRGGGVSRTFCMFREFARFFFFTPCRV